MATYITIDDVVFSEQDGNAVFSVKLSAAAPAGGVAITYSTADGTATTAASDYTSTSGTLTIAQGASTGTISVPIGNDATLEQIKGFLLQLSTATADAYLARTTATATLIDNDAATGTPNVSAGDVVVDEAAGTATVVITLDKPATGTVTVDYATQAATAVAGDDYTATSGTVSFAAGETVKTITVLITNDGTAEGREVLALALTGASGATIADPRAHIVIQANDVTAVASPTVNVQGSTMVEGQGYVDFIVTLSAPGSGAVSVHYATANGTASAGTDYIAVIGTLTFAPGETSKLVRVIAGDDAVVDGGKSFNLGLSNVSGGSLGVTTASGILIDNESPAPVYNVNPVVITSTSAGDVVGGTLYPDELWGGSGNDLLDGRADFDYMYGGSGDDIYIAEENGGGVWEDSGAGNDTIISYLSTLTLPANFENVVLGGTGNLNATGNTLDNYLKGNTGDNLLTGGDGNDTLDGGTAGDDTLVGGVGNDTYVVDTTTDTLTELTGEGTDTVQSSASYTLGSEVENLTLTGSAAVNGTGNTLNNVITGNSGNNTLAGDAGDDTLDGQGGNDTMIGGAGDDVYVVDSSSDVVTEGASAGADTVQAAITYTLGSNVERLELTGAGNINGNGNTLANSVTGNSGNNNLFGGDGNDTLIGAGGNDFIVGGTGADSMVGGTGNDTYAIDNAGDTVSEAASEGTDTVITSLSYTAGDNVENVTLYASASINATGNALNNVLNGNSGVNILSGGAGNDILVGAGANDSFVFDTALSAATNVDRITDFAAGDQIILDNDVFAALGAAGAMSASLFYAGSGWTGSTSAAQGAGIYHDTSSGSLYYDADGNGGVGGVKFAVLAGAPTLDSTAFQIQD